MEGEQLDDPDEAGQEAVVVPRLLPGRRVRLHTLHQEELRLTHGIPGHGNGSIHLVLR